MNSEDSLVAIIITFSTLGFSASAVLMALVKAYFQRSQSILIEALFFTTLALLTAALNLPFLGFDFATSPSSSLIFASLFLIVINIRSVDHYLKLVKSPSPKHLLVVRASVIATLLLPIYSLFGSPAIGAVFLGFIVIYSLFSYLYVQRDLFDLGHEFKLGEHIWLIGAVVGAAYTASYLLWFNTFALTPGFLWLVIILVNVCDYLAGIPSKANHSGDESSIDDLNQALADQNLELQFTLRELKEKNYELEKLNTLDALSGIHNRRHFDKRILAELRRTRRERLPLALVMFDIDHFKAVNDNYGHIVGDEVIRSVALTSAESLQRSSDEAFRYGGEEFALILPNTDAEGALTLAEKIRAKIANQTIAAPSGQVQCTASFGIGFTDSSKSMSPKELISQADDALYEAKRNGRNQVITYNSKDVLNGTP